MSLSPLEVLPGELQECILSLISQDPPSDQNFHRRPTETLTRLGSTTPLKSLSLCSSRLRHVTTPHIYNHSLVKLDDVEAFKLFLTRHTLAEIVRSVVILVDGTCENAPSNQGIRTPPHLTKLLQILPSLSSFTVVCPPTAFPLLTLVPVSLTDAWTFNMPYQNLRLQLDPVSCQRTRLLNHPDDIFKALPWHSLSVNEGSFFRAYTQYEYFLRKPPSIMLGQTESPTSSLLPPSFLANLKHFSYTAIFPFYNHITLLLYCIENRMPNLHSLTVCLSPNPDEFDKVKDQETQESSGKIDLNDVWMEFETAYEILAYHVQQMGLINLRTFRSIDWTYGGEIQRIAEDRIMAHLELEAFDKDAPLRHHLNGKDYLPPIWENRKDGSWQVAKASRPFDSSSPSASLASDDREAVQLAISSLRLI